MKVVKTIDIYVQDNDLIRGFYSLYYDDGTVEEYNSIPMEIIYAQDNTDNIRISDNVFNAGGTKITTYEIEFITPVEYNPIENYYGLVRTIKKG